MTWRFIEQPNGKLARFSERVNGITEYDMSDEEALRTAMQDYHLSRECAQKNVQWARVGRKRWEEAIAIIRRVHGDAEVEECIKMMSEQ